MIELINERHFADWSAICNTPDSRLYKRLVQQHDRAEVPNAMWRPEPIGEVLLLGEADEG